MVLTHLLLILLLPAVWHTGCQSPASAEAGYIRTTATPTPNSLINPRGTTLHTRINVPQGYTRIKAPAGSYLAYLRQLPLKPDGAPVLYFHGGEKGNPVQAAVIDMEIGTRDLQQCADAIIRLRSEYLYKANRHSDIHYNFTSGDKAEYSRYAQGYRAVVTGNNVSWQKKAAPDNSYRTFRQYLDLVFTYAGTASLAKELVPVPNLTDIQPGDVFIQGGHPGHAVLVADVAVHNTTGQKLVLLAQSYMPAQDIHILINLHSPALSPWYQAHTAGSFPTPEWQFTTANLMRFRN